LNVFQGWSHAQKGYPKASIVETTEAKEGYEATQHYGSGNEDYSTDTYFGISKAGRDFRIRFKLTATPGQRAVFAITQIRDV
jgi:hypothetical protein